MLLTHPLTAQPTWLADSLLERPQRMLAVPPSGQLLVDQEQNIVLLGDKGQLMYKYLALFAYDSSIVIGGKGSGSEAFIHASKLAATSRMEVYVLDDAQSKILLFNPNFKLIRALDFLEISSIDRPFLDELDILPISFDINVLGDLFVLNQHDNRIYRYNSRGELDGTFGGMDYGAGQLLRPVDVVAHTDQRVYVSDTNQQQVHVFDAYGLYVQALELGAGSAAGSWHRFRCYEAYGLYIGQEALVLQHFPTRQSYRVPLEWDQALLDVQLNKDFLYLLFKNAVYIYPLR